MRQAAIIFVAVLLALLAYAGIRYVVRKNRIEHEEAQEQAREASADEQATNSLVDSSRNLLKTRGAWLSESMMTTEEEILWPPVLANHRDWKWADLKKACGKPARGNASELDYKDASGNLVQFNFGPTGVDVGYADPPRVSNPDLIASINSIPCLSAMKERPSQ